MASVGSGCLHDTRMTDVLQQEGPDQMGRGLEDWPVTVLKDGLQAPHSMHCIRNHCVAQWSQDLGWGTTAAPQIHGSMDSWPLDIPVPDLRQACVSHRPQHLTLDWHLMQLAQRAPRTLTRNADSAAKLVGILTARCGVPEESIGKVLTRCVLPSA